jgi:adenylate kinase
MLFLEGYVINVIIFGMPGAGKGTQCSLISERIGLVHISTGDLIRKEISEKTEIGKEAESIINKGLLLDDSIISKIFLNEFKKHEKGKGFLFDGYPRTVKQAQMLNDMLNELNLKPNLFIEIVLPVEVAVKRILKRAQIEGRSDDREETVVARIAEYNKKTSPVKDYFIEKGIYNSVEGIGSVEEINNRITNIIIKSVV